ncbi:hypothetical protein AAFC00_005963 [Neodothiora populina]|uniref:Uncharacterized protein n=1 Tax=Neodothiora populina TaxID=2781224 RepID=A0ABR3P7U7_9PEZI
MNRFLNKKKSGDEVLSPPQAGKKWRKAKQKAPVEPQKPQLDLTAALPSTDDFRTSLIMPSLSTRFSMLREQDDPSSKLGKASDDSVLQPQRNSRLLDFGFSSNALNDIAEVSSINSSIRPPFANERHESYASEEGYGTDNDSSHGGSMMSRARPGEGNVLFGGRQKVYKIATGSARSISGASERNMGGRILYEDDLNMSAFQKYRQHQQREAAAQMAGEEHLTHEQDNDLGETGSLQHDSDETLNGIGLGLLHSDSTGPTSFKRSSDSTTTSAPSQERTSTSATSVASQAIGTAVTTPSQQPMPKTAPPPVPLERSLTKRRLYEQGLERNIHQQQSSTLTRLNSIQRHRSPTVGGVASPPTLSHSRSIGQMQERGFQPYVLQNSSQSAANAFPPLAIRKPSSTASSPVDSYPQSPLSPTMSDAEEYKTLHSALEPSDRGKATAMGAFNKPKQQYDENQYMQRQAQLQRSHQASISRQDSVDSTKRSDLARFDSARHTEEKVQPRSGSISSQTEPKPNMAFSVFQNAAVHNRTVHVDNPTAPPAAPLPPPPTMADTHKTFFGDISASDDEEEDVASESDRVGSHYAPNTFLASPPSNRFAPTPLPSVSEHPALRHESPSISELEEEPEEIDADGGNRVNDTIAQAEGNENVPFFTQMPAGLGPESEGRPGSSDDYKEDVDSPTIGKKDGLGGLIQHLRNTSDQSSIYGMASAMNATSTNSNAWDLDELDKFYGEGITTSPLNRRQSIPVRGQPLAPAPSKGNIYSSRPSTRDSEVIDGPMWQSDFKKQHTRDASTATQAERQAFDNELAARQKAIQEKMRSIVESESRATSPAPSAGGALKAFGMLKSKASQETMSSQGPPKTMKMRALGMQSSVQEKQSFYEDPQANDSGFISQTNGWTNTSNPQWPLGGFKEQKSSATHPSQRSPTQRAASRERSRTRSGSVASASRSRSRTNAYRDEFASPPEIPQLPQTRPSVDTAQSVTPPMTGDAQGRGRMRSSSKASAYFDHKPSFPAINTQVSGRMTPGGGSLASASTATFASSNSSMPRPSYSTTTSSKSGMSPLGVPHVSAVRPTGSLLRKKTITKADIGEPTLISSTSNVDTVDLPTARTIVQPPLIPALNPRRRVYTNGEGGPPEMGRSAFSPPPGQQAPGFVKPAGLRSVRSQDSIDGPAAKFDAIGSPVMNEAGMF